MNTVYYIYLVLFKIAELDVVEMMYGMKDAAPLLLSLLFALTSPAAAKEQVSCSSSIFLSPSVKKICIDF